MCLSEVCFFLICWSWSETTWAFLNLIACIPRSIREEFDLRIRGELRSDQSSIPPLGSQIRCPSNQKLVLFAMQAFCSNFSKKHCWMDSWKLACTQRFLICKKTKRVVSWVYKFALAIWRQKLLPIPWNKIILITRNTQNCDPRWEKPSKTTHTIVFFVGFCRFHRRCFKKRRRFLTDLSFLFEIFCNAAKTSDSLELSVSVLVLAGSRLTRPKFCRKNTMLDRNALWK